MNLKAGFTLIELLIAIVIFALISTMAYSSLNTVLSSYEHLNIQQQRLHTLSKFMFQLQNELRAIIPRPVFDQYNTQLPALSLTATSLSFTHAGTPMVSKLPKNPLQRLEYFVTAQQLHKKIWLTADRNRAEDFKQYLLLEAISQIKIEALGYDKAWYSEWPTPNTPLDLLPLAIRIIFTTEKYGEISRLFVLPA